MPRPLGHHTDQRPLAEWEYVELRRSLAPPWRLVYELVATTEIGLSDVLALRREDFDYPYLRTPQAPGMIALPYSLADELRSFMMDLRRHRIFARGNRETPYTEQAAHAALKAAARRAGVRTSVHPELYRRFR